MLPAARVCQPILGHLDVQVAGVVDNRHPSSDRKRVLDQWRELERGVEAELASDLDRARRLRVGGVPKQEDEVVDDGQSEPLGSSTDDPEVLVRVKP